MSGKVGLPGATPAAGGAARADVGIIGGSGLYDLPGLTGAREIRVPTPFGDPSGALVLGTLAGRSVAFVPRHGTGHTLAPASVPYRANIYALKSLGVRQVIGVSAVGSLREDLRPGSLVVPDQIIDLTRGFRPSSFFGNGLVVHVPFADPFCGRLRSLLVSAVRSAGATARDGGTYCCMEGPQFSTRAESHLYRRWGADVIGMTASPEARLAREAELCYAGVCLVTDYDCWRPEEAEDVSAGAVADVMARNITVVRAAIVALAESLDSAAECGCQSALTSAVLTNPEAVSFVLRAQNSLLIDKYLPAGSGGSRPVTGTRAAGARAAEEGPG